MRLRPALMFLRRIVLRHGARWALGLLLTALGVSYQFGYWQSETITRLDSFIAGLRMRLDPVQLDPRVVIIDIDGKALNEIGRFPWGRNVQARLVDQLFDHYHVAAMGYDISFPEPDTSSGYGVLDKLAHTELRDVPQLADRLAGLKRELDYDGLFATALQGRKVVLGFNMSTDQRKGAMPRPLFTADELNGRDLVAYTYPGYEGNIVRLLRATGAAGTFSVVPDDDGLVRSVGLVQRVGDNYYPSLALATAMLYLDAQTVKPLLDENIDALSQNQREAGGVEYLQIIRDAHQRVLVPVGFGLTTVVQFRGRGGPGGGAFRYISAADVLAGRAPAAALKGAVVLVGTTAPGLVDLRATPVNKDYPGVEVHANVIKSILDHRFKVYPAWADSAEAIAVLALGLTLTFVLALLGPVPAVALTATVLAAVLGVDHYLYARQDVTLNIGMLLLTIAGLFVVNLGWGYVFEFRKGRALVNRFGEYVAPELVAEMADDPDAYHMDGESRELTVMFVDVRGFTTISEGLAPKELREYINLYLTAMSEDIRSAWRGTLDKYIGDAVMAFWGAPVHQADHASRAVATALLMHASAARLNTQFIERGWPPLKIGIGLNTGMMHVGDMGSAIRRAYTVMGDAVNLASRLEGITKVYGVGVCVGAATRQQALEFVYRELDQVRVKGKHEPVAIFEPLGKAEAVDAATMEALALWHAALAQVRAQAWDAAEASLDALQAADPERGLYALYRERIAWYRAHPPGPDWDGVTTFDTK